MIIIIRILIIDRTVMRTTKVPIKITMIIG